MARRKKARKIFLCVECGTELTGSFHMGFELTCVARECVDKNNAKWRSLSDEEFKEKQKEPQPFKEVVSV